MLEAQQASVMAQLDIRAAEEELKKVKRLQELARETANVLATTEGHRQDLRRKAESDKHETMKTEITLGIAAAIQRLDGEIQKIEKHAENVAAALLLDKLAAEQHHEFDVKASTLRIAELQAEIAGFVDKANAIGPYMAEAALLTADATIAKAAAENMGWTKLIGGESPMDTLKTLLGELGVGDGIGRALSAATALRNRSPEEGGYRHGRSESHPKGNQLPIIQKKAD